MTDQELDKMMRKVLSDAIELDCTSGGEQFVSFEPSRRHQQQMQSMLKNPLNWVRKKTRPLWKQALQRVAVILLVISVSFGGVMAISPTARAAVIRWFVEWYETHIVYRYAGDDISGKIPRYEITELPGGYKETGRTEDTLWVTVEYKNADGDVIYLDYNYMQQGGMNAFASESDTVVDITVNSLEGLLFIPQNPESWRKVTWADSSINIQFIVTAAFDEAELLRMAESVQIKN